MSVARRRQMIEPEHPRLSIVRQCELVSISRSAYYGPVRGEGPLNLALMRLIDEQFWRRRGTARGRWPATCIGRATRSAANGCGG